MTLPEQRADLATHHIEGYAHAAIAAGDDGHFDVPLISHVVDNLWVGGCRDGVRLPDDFVHVVSLYPWERYALGPDTTRIEHRLYDSADVPDADVLDSIASDAQDALRRGPTLIHCQAGLNRSNLIAALVLRKRGYDSAASIALLRAKRSPVVLCNRAFERFLLDLDEVDSPTPHSRKDSK